MTRDGVSIAIVTNYRTAEFVLNEALRALAESYRNECQARNIEVILDLDSDLPKIDADGDQLQMVLSSLFVLAQRAIRESDNTSGNILLRTAISGGRIQLSMTHDGLAEPIDAADQRLDLTVCAQIVQDQAGELCAWRPRRSAGTTIMMDLPT